MNAKNNAKILKEKCEENDQLKNILNQLENKKNFEVIFVFFFGKLYKYNRNRL